MAGSDITVSSLVVIDDVKGVKLQCIVTDPWPKDMRTSLDAVEFWEATVNDRAHGSFAKVGEGLTGFSRAGLNRGDIRFYWSRARNKYGSYGPWHPSSATAGVVGTEVSGDVSITGFDGYWKHPSGLIHQWGRSNVAGTATISYPISFPNGYLNIVATINAISIYDRYLSVAGISQGEFSASIKDGAGVNQTEEIYWHAIGY